MFCNACGKQIAESAKFCPHCGAAVSVPVQQPVQPVQPTATAAQQNAARSGAPKKKFPILAVIIPVAVIAVLVAAFFILRAVIPGFPGGGVAPAESDTNSVGTAPSGGETIRVDDEPTGAPENEPGLPTTVEPEPTIEAQMQLVTSDVSSYPLVQLYLRVTDPQTGEAIPGLSAADFTVLERLDSGAFLEREVRSAEQLAGNQGLNIALVADKSSSISYTDMDKIKTVMTEFVDRLDFTTGDRAEVLAFDSIVQQMCTFTDSATLLKNGIGYMSTDGTTALYNALHDGVNHATLQGGARCVIAFTDGQDNESFYTPREIVDYANQNQVPIYIIGVGYDVDTYTLQDIAWSTGGQYWFIDDLYDLEEIYDTIYRQQMQIYAVEYVSDSAFGAYDFREIDVSVNGSGCYAETATGFTPAWSVEQTAHPNRYELVQGAYTWEEAALLCQQMGGHLATITSRGEMDELIAMAEAADVKYLWLGGYTSYDDSGNVFGHWVTGEEFSFEAWAQDEPSRVDRDGTSEWYIMLWNIESLGGWTWNDQRNDPVAVVASMADGMGFICEYEN